MKTQQGADDSERWRIVQEAEALPKDVLRAEVEAALRDTLDMKLFDRVSKKKSTEITSLVRQLKALRP
jgi:hypothetical protein